MELIDTHRLIDHAQTAIDITSPEISVVFYSIIGRFPGIKERLFSVIGTDCRRKLISGRRIL